MLLLSSKLLKFLKLSSNFAYILQVLPYKWNKGKLVQVEFQLPYWNFYSWTYIKFIPILYEIFLIIRTIQSILEFGTSKFNLVSTMIEVLFTVGFLIPTIIQILFIHKSKEILSFTNKYLEYYLKIQDKIYDELRIGKDKINTLKTPAWQMEFELIFYAVVVIAFTSPGFITIFLIQHPRLRVSFSSFLFLSNDLETQTQSLWKLIVLNLPCFWLVLTAWGVCIAFLMQMLLFLYSTIFLMEIIRPNFKGIPTEQANNNMFFYIFTYRRVQLLMSHLNSITSDYIALFLNNLQLTLGVLCTCVMIQFHHILTYEALFGGLCFTCSSTVYLFISYTKLGQLNVSSDKTIKCWKRHFLTKTNFPKYAKKLCSLYIQASQCLKFELGEFGYYKKSGALRILGKLIFYISKVLLITKKYV